MIGRIIKHVYLSIMLVLTLFMLYFTYLIGDWKEAIESLLISFPVFYIIWKEYFE